MAIKLQVWVTASQKMEDVFYDFFDQLRLAQLIHESREEV